MENIKVWDCGMEAPAVYINSVAGDGHNVMEACRRIGCPPFSLISIYGFDFDSCMTPWPAPGVRKGQAMFAGQAARHLERLTCEIMPGIESKLEFKPTYSAVAGYSLAGLFAFWSAWNTDRFSRIACGSASFWYPGFTEYIMSHEMVRVPDYIYFSLGDNESNTRHPLMSQVGKCTDRILEFTSRQGIPHTFETMPGNHFSDPDGRLARAIKAMLTWQP